MTFFVDYWCPLVTLGDTLRKKPRRFTVTLSDHDYRRLVALGNRHRPALTQNYLVNWSIQRLLERAEDPQLMLELAHPLNPIK
jgi:hypothetical protein